MNQATQSLRLIRRACALLLALLLAGCGSDSVATESPVSVPHAAPAEPPAAPDHAVPAAVEEATSHGPVIAATNGFALALLARTAAEKANENLAVSPLSLGLALGMLAEGAKGATRAELERALGITDESGGPSRLGDLGRELLASDEDVQFSLANGVWLGADLKLQPAYQAQLVKAFNAEAGSADFSAPQTVNDINQWFAERTAGLIPRMLESLDPATRLVLGNALHFKGTWRESFDPAQTRESAFHAPGGERMVQTMHGVFPSGRYLETGNAQVLALPFGLGNFEMLVALPAPGVAPESLLAPDAPWSRAEGWAVREVELALPKITLDSGGSVREALKAQGLKTLWDGSAELGGMAAEPLAVSDVVHRVSLVVEETGAEAAAATAVLAVRSVAPRPPAVQMHVDRPYLLLLRHGESGVVIIAALVRQP